MKTALNNRMLATIDALRARRPLVHYFPNLVTAADVANALLAAGASPIMAVAADEVRDLQPDAVALNMGTPTPERLTGMAATLAAAQARDLPVVLDPVGVGATPFRRQSARHLLEAMPSVMLRLNSAEAATLLLDTPHGRGVDVGVEPADRLALARGLARAGRRVVAMTGAQDIVTNGERTAVCHNGHAWLAQMTGAGCIATGLVAACAAVEPDRLIAALAGLVLLGVSAEHAADAAYGPGTFRVALFDALAAADATSIGRSMRVEWID